MRACACACACACADAAPACFAPQPLPLPCARGAAHGACRLRDFRAFVAPYVPVDFGEECAAPAEAEGPAH